MCESKCSGVSNTSVREISSTVVLRNYSRGGRGRLEKAGEIELFGLGAEVLIDPNLFEL